MSNERTFKINIKTAADTSGVELAKKSVEQLKGEVSDFEAKLDRINAEAEVSGEAAGAGLAGGIESGAKKRAAGFDIEGILGRVAAIAGAVAVGKEIGDALAGAIERVHDRGFSWDSIMGNYDPREDDNLIRFREGLRELREDLAKPAEVGLLESLNAVRDAAKEAADQLKHLRELQGIDDKAREAETKAMRDDEAKAIQENPNLSPEQKAVDLAGLEKQRLMEGAQQRDSKRLQDESAALDDAELKAEVAARAKRAAEEQRTRANEALAADDEALQNWTLKGFEGVPSEDYLKKNRREGLGLGKEEAKNVPKLEAEAEKAAKDAQDAQREARQVSEKNIAESAADWQNTNRAIRDAEPKVDAGKLNGAADAATSAADDVGKSAEKLATSTADSSSRIAGDLRNLTQVMLSSMSSIQAAVADNSRAIAAVAQRTDAASQMAAAALAAVNDNRAGARINNRR